MIDNTTDPILKSLETAYHKGQYDLFQNILIENKSKFDQRIFHYNLGTGLLKKGEFPAAVYHLEKSDFLGGVGTRSAKNLLFAKKQVGLTLLEEENGNKGIEDWFHHGSLSIPPSAYLTFSLVMGILFLILGKFKRGKTFGTFLILCAITLFPFLFRELHLKKMRFAIALKNSTIREGPSRIFTQANVLPAGFKIIVEYAGDGWYYIKSPTFYSGWISKDEIGIL